jgi:hypothetical protein
MILGIYLAAISGVQPERYRPRRHKGVFASKKWKFLLNEI